jgi:hypothetical protein
MTYTTNPEARGKQRQAPSTAPELATFTISRLTELVVVLFRDHVGYDAAALRDRAEGQAVLLALGDTAAEHGHAELRRVLHGFAALIGTQNRTQQEALDRPRGCMATLSYEW